jgi:TorA maturation chaperone TorD
MADVQTLVFEAPGREEEAARADFYGLLASLFGAPPSQQLLDRIAAADRQAGGALDAAWSELVDAARRTDAATVRDEYESLFIGVGKPEVMLYGSYYLSGFLMEKPLVALRDDLAALGLRRPVTVAETEDHVAALCEVMRHLILSDDVVAASLASQKRFFGTHLQPWAETFCTTLEAHPQARFYAAAARLAHGFFDIEMQAFDLFG